MNIRKLKKSDIHQWSAMRTALWPDTNDGHLSELEEYFSRESVDIEIAYCAEVNGEVCGFIELNIRSFAEGSRNAQVPYVEGWFVRPEFRDQGLGSALMKQAAQWATGLGFSELASDTDIDNLDSIARHKRLGFKETYRVVCFLKKLN